MASGTPLMHEEAILRLKGFSQVSRIEYQARPPVQAAEFEGWSRRYGTELPHDLISLYRQFNGLDASWRYGVEDKVAGRFVLNPIHELLPLHIAHKNSTKIPFVILARDSFGTVFMSLSELFERGSVWFSTESYSTSTGISIDGLHMLCESFASYYRLMTLHYGIIAWQYAFVPQLGLPIFTRLLMARFCPDRLAIDLALTQQLEHDPSDSASSEYSQARFGAGILALIG